MKNKTTLNLLKEMSNNLGFPGNNFVILNEGNTSAKAGKIGFYIKSSGTCLADITEDGFVLVQLDKVLSLLDHDNPGKEKVQTIYSDAVLSTDKTLRPSVETLMHAVCLSYDNINFVAHTHPVSINKLTCSKSYPENLKGRMYPDEIVFLGTDSVFVDYISPGVLLGKKIKYEIDRFIEKYSVLPRAVYLKNHGFMALGETAKEVENITYTADKAAKVRLGAMLAGGISLLSSETVNKIADREDEKYREDILNK